jgi:hypothetical protein
MQTKFTAAKPFDAIAVMNGTPVAIEAKYLPEYKAFGHRHLRESQKTGLDDFQRAGGQSYVFLNIRNTGVNDMLIIPWIWLQGDSIKKDRLLVWAHKTVGFKKRYNIEPFELMVSGRLKALFPL